MAKIIKLENIQPPKKGEAEQPTEEYVCGGCRELVGKDDKVCWQCGEKLEPSEMVEHYHKGEKLSNSKFKERKAQLQGGANES